MGPRLILVRHAKSDYPPGVADHDRPLNPRGERDAPMIGRWLSTRVGLDEGAVPVVLVSSARRAQLTWQAASGHAGPAWSRARVDTEPGLYEASSSRLRRILAEAGDVTGASTVVIVGHNPGLHDLLVELGAPSEVRSEAASRFPTSAVAVLETDAAWSDALAGHGTFEVTSFAIPRG